MKHESSLCRRADCSPFVCAIIGAMVWSRFAANSASLQLDGKEIQSAAPEPERRAGRPEAKRFASRTSEARSWCCSSATRTAPDICPTTLAS